jgi:rare lipoprotein A
MKNVIIFVLAVVAALEFSALCIVVPDNTVKALQLRDLDELTAANGVKMADLTDRLIFIESASWMETIASYYGEDHRGRITASGKPFNPDELTAASPWLPFGSRWKVERLDTRATVQVVITDRGPAPRLGRGLDLSKAAAVQLGIVRKGLVRVSISPAFLGVPVQGK